MIAILGLMLALAAPACPTVDTAGPHAVEARVQVWTVSQIDRLDAGPAMPDQPPPAILFANVLARGETVGEIAVRGLAQALDRRPGPRPERLFVSVSHRGAVMPFEVEAVRQGKAGYRLLLDAPVEVC